MAIKIIAPERETFELTESDKKYNDSGSEATTVTIIQATVRQNAERSRLFQEYIKEVHPEGEDRMIFKLPIYDLVLKEIYLTLVDSNLEDGERSLFSFKQTLQGSILNMDWKQFYTAAGKLTDDVLNEIHDKVLKVNPHWLFSIGPEGSDLGEGSSEANSNS